jgi:hypothetical protein
MRHITVDINELQLARKIPERHIAAVTRRGACRDAEGFDAMRRRS